MASVPKSGDELSGDPEASRGQSYVWLVVVGLVACMALLQFTDAAFLAVVRIPTDAMSPSMLRGDYIIGTKSLLAAPIQRGTIVFFEYPRNPSDTYVKRVVGLPGDTVEVRDNLVLIDGETLSVEGTTNTLVTSERCVSSELPTTSERSGDRTWSVLAGTASELKFGQPPVEIPPGHYFVLGDHRGSSQDSRMWGLLPSENILGTASLVWWSWDECTGAPRWDRFGVTL